MPALLETAVPPPPHLQLATNSPWPPYNNHCYPSTASSPTPMTPESLTAYGPRLHDSPLPSQEASVPSSGWFGASVSAPDAQNEVRQVLPPLPILADSQTSPSPLFLIASHLCPPTHLLVPSLPTTSSRRLPTFPSRHPPPLSTQLATSLQFLSVPEVPRARSQSSCVTPRNLLPKPLASSHRTAREALRWSTLPGP